MAHAPRIATPTVMVVDRAFGALTGRTSSSTWLTTASASARPTNTTNAYIFVPPLRRTARRSQQFDHQREPWLPNPGIDFSVTLGPRGRSDLSDGRRPGARQGVPAR